MKSHARLSNEERYKLFSECKDDISRQFIAMVLYAFHLIGFRKKRLHKIYDMILDTLNAPKFMGKSIEGNDVLKFMECTYGFDFSEVVPKIETEKEYLKRGKDIG